MREVARTFAAAAAFLSLPLLYTTYVVFFGPGFLNEDGTPDNAPNRGAGLLLLAMPAVFLVAAAYYKLAPAILGLVVSPTLPPLLLINGVVATLPAAFVAFHASREFGFGDAAFAFLALFGLSFVLLALGSLAWWALRPVRRITNP